MSFPLERVKMNGDVRQLFPSRMAQRAVADKVQCHCPNRTLGCEAVMKALEVEQHLQSDCEWREEECDQCHQQVPRIHMSTHKQLLCPQKPEGSMATSGWDGMGAAHPTQHDFDQELSQTQHDLAQTTAELSQTMTELAQTKEQTQRELAAVQQQVVALRAQINQSFRTALYRNIQPNWDHFCLFCLVGRSGCLIPDRAFLSRAPTDFLHWGSLATVRQWPFPYPRQLFIPPAAPEGLKAHWDEATKEVALDWRPVPPASLPVPVAAEAAPLAACSLPFPPPVRYRVQATLVTGGADGGSTAVTYMGPECHCRYRFSFGLAPDAEARFAVVAMRGLAESRPSAPASCTRPGPPTVVFDYDHDMDEQGLFYYIGTQGRTQPWQNPANAGWVTATRSSDCVRLFTPTRYTLRHSRNEAIVPFRLQSWRLEGSVDGASWRTLDEHTKEPDAIPARPDAMVTFAVAPERAFTARLFRVLMTQPRREPPSAVVGPGDVRHPKPAAVKAPDILLRVNLQVRAGKRAFNIRRGAYNPVEGLLSRLQGFTAYVTLAAMYFVFGVASIFSPIFISRCGPRISLFLGSIGYFLFIGACAIGVDWLIIVAGILGGIGGSLLWPGQGAYLGRVDALSRKPDPIPTSIPLAIVPSGQSPTTSPTEDGTAHLPPPEGASNMGLFSGICLACNGFSGIIGFLISLFADVTPRMLYIILLIITACSCFMFFFTRRMAPVPPSEGAAIPPEPEQKGKAGRQRQKRKSAGAFCVAIFRPMLRVAASWLSLLYIPSFIFFGVSYSFFAATVPPAILTASFVSICFICRMVLVMISDRLGRFPCLAFTYLSAVVAVVLVLIALGVGLPADWLYFVAYALWGIVEGGLPTLIYGLNVAWYPDATEAIFGVFCLFRAVLGATFFLLSAYLAVLPLAIAVLVLAGIGFGCLCGAFGLQARRKRRNAERVVGTTAEVPGAAEAEVKIGNCGISTTPGDMMHVRTGTHSLVAVSPLQAAASAPDPDTAASKDDPPAEITLSLAGPDLGPDPNSAIHLSRDPSPLLLSAEERTTEDRKDARLVTSLPPLTRAHAHKDTQTSDRLAAARP
ncbi:hypothetical protein PAPYR_10924 [Paratrimastix pyriformis]|uniref:UNC93-like protein MFSD11 n=1 Tax=Paratrimastix pyriformis TaxID=342808 RepID=A0ABQ8U9V6_9EUKA|nr:hypothetical protein PAPYR_10924 [Paratrimastix pyriformis]